VIQFGTGAFTKADSIEIIWPDGDRSIFYGVDVDSMYAISGKEIKLGGEKPLSFNNCQEIIFPNPTSNEARLAQLDNSKMIQSIEVVNYLGQKVFYKEIKDYLDTYLISTKNWSNGTYVIKVLYQDENYCFSRFQILR
jgi:hypothetical protein